MPLRLAGWIENPTGATQEATHGIAYGGSTWVLVGVSGNIYTIADFTETDVTTRTSGTSEHLLRVFYKE